VPALRPQQDNCRRYLLAVQVNHFSLSSWAHHDRASIVLLFLCRNDGAQRIVVKPLDTSAVFYSTRGAKCKPVERPMTTPTERFSGSAHCQDTMAMRQEIHALYSAKQTLKHGKALQASLDVIAAALLQIVHRHPAVVIKFMLTKMNRYFLVAYRLRRPALLIVGLFAVAAASAATTQRVVVFVWDGLRPDSITAADTPTLARFRDDGANFSQHHSVYPTLTMINAAALATGNYPQQHGFYGNWIWSPTATGHDSQNRSIDFRQPVFTETMPFSRHSTPRRRDNYCIPIRWSMPRSPAA